LQVLEEFLSEFGGCVLIVSHDRYFIDKLVDHVFVFEGNGVIKDYPGNYTEYREWKQEQKEESKLPKNEAVTVKPVEVKPAADTKRLSYKEQRELELIEKEIGQLEQKKIQLEKVLGTTTEYEALQKVSNDLKLNNEVLEEKTMRWLELQEKMA